MGVITDRYIKASAGMVICKFTDTGMCFLKVGVVLYMLYSYLFMCFAQHYLQIVARVAFLVQASNSNQIFYILRLKTNN